MYNRENKESEKITNISHNCQSIHYLNPQILRDSISPLYRNNVTEADETCSCIFLCFVDKLLITYHYWTKNLTPKLKLYTKSLYKLLLSVIAQSNYFSEKP